PVVRFPVPPVVARSPDRATRPTEALLFVTLGGDLRSGPWRGHLRLAATADVRSRFEGQTGSGVGRPQRAEQDQEEGPRRLLVVLLCGLPSATVAVAGTPWRNAEFRAIAGCGSRPAEPRQQVRFAHARLASSMVHPGEGSTSCPRPRTVSAPSRTGAPPRAAPG